jgi:protein phosphatase
MEYYAISDTGNVRDQNEDYYYAGENLFIVADGMGGHAAGEVASKNAVDSFVRFFSKKIKRIKPGQDKKINDNDINRILISSMEHANKNVYGLSLSKKEYKGMGTTLTACFLKDSAAHIVHIGDSRVYSSSGDAFKLLTRDHTVVGSMYRNGLISYDETFMHPLKNYLENVIGMESFISPDYLKTDLVKKDIILICSDGLNSMLKDADIEKIVKKGSSAREISENLVKKAKSNGGLDNITVIILII